MSLATSVPEGVPQTPGFPHGGRFSPHYIWLQVSGGPLPPKPGSWVLEARKPRSAGWASRGPWAYGGRGQGGCAWCLCVAVDKALPSPPEAPELPPLSLLHEPAGNEGDWYRPPTLRAWPQSLLLSLSSPGLPTNTCLLLCPQALWNPRTMDALNRNQVGAGCKTQAMVKVSGVKAKGQEGCRRGWVWLLSPPVAPALG